MKKDKPDYETESFRAWKPNKEEKKSLDKGCSLKVKVGDYQMGLIDYDLIKNKEDKVMFAFKFKHNECVVLYYIPEDLAEEERKIVDDILENMIRMNKETGADYEMQDAKELFKNIMNEHHALDKL